MTTIRTSRDGRRSLVRASVLALSLVGPFAQQSAWAQATSPAPQTPSPAAPSAPAAAAPASSAGTSAPSTSTAAPTAAPGATASPSAPAAPAVNPPPTNGDAQTGAAPETDARAKQPDVPPASDRDRDLKDKDSGDSNDDDSKKSSESAAAPGDPWGDTGESKDVGGIKLRAMLQVRYSTSSAEHSSSPRSDYVVREEYLARQGDGWKLNRLFLRVGADPTEYLGFKTILDFGELAAGHTSNTIKQAYVSLHPFGPHLDIVSGIMKLPFSTMELDAIADYELSRLGVSDDLIKDLGFGGRDVGAEVIYSPLGKARWLSMTLGAYEGHSHDEHASPVGALGARVESEPLKGLRFGADAVHMPSDLEYRRPFDTSSKDVLPNPPDPFYPTAQHWRAGTAASADFSLDRWHWRFRVEGLAGDRIDVDTAYGAKHFMGAWALLAYRFRAGPVHFMPTLRAEWLDMDSTNKGGVMRQVAVGWNTSFSKRVNLVLDVTRIQVEDGTPVLNQPTPLQTDPYMDLSRTLFTGQLQVQI